MKNMADQQFSHKIIIVHRLIINVGMFLSITKIALGTEE